MPVATELSDEFPDLRGHRIEIDAVGNLLQVQIRCREIREGFHARFGGLRRAATKRLSIAVHYPCKQDIDDIGIDRSSTTGLIGLAVKGAFLDLHVTSIGDRLCNIEQ